MRQILNRADTLDCASGSSATPTADRARLRTLVELAERAIAQLDTSSAAGGPLPSHLPGPAAAPVPATQGPVVLPVPPLPVTTCRRARTSLAAARTDPVGPGAQR